MKTAGCNGRLFRGLTDIRARVYMMMTGAIMSHRYAILHAASLEVLDRHQVVYISPVYTVDVYRRHTRRWDQVTRPLYPGYVFLREDYLPRFFAVVRSGRVLATDGVVHYVTEDQIVYSPPPEPPKVLAVVGNHVKVTQGPFLGVMGVVEAADGEMIMISTSLGKLKLPQALCEVIFA